MTNKTKNSEVASQPSPEQVKMDLVITQINELLKENGLTLQATLTGYPYKLQPVIQVVPIPTKVEEVDESNKEQDA